MRRALAASLTVAAVAVGYAAPALGARPRTVLVTAAGPSEVPVGARQIATLAPTLRAYELAVPAGETAETYADQLRRTSGVYAAQPDFRMHRSGLASTCADPPDVNAAQVVSNAVGATAIHVPPTGPIAILDTGVDPSVPELHGRVLPGINTADGTTDTSDNDGHGTEVAAVAAAAPGRFQGVSPTSPILPVTVYSRNSDTTAAWFVKGIAAAVAAGARVINISSSNPATDVSSSDVSVLQQAILSAFDKGSIVIAAAGNEGKNIITIPSSLPHVLSVGSAGVDGTRDAFSDYGPFLDLTAPGANLTLPAPPAVCPSGYGLASGTSFSAPAVAGGAAIIAAQRPTLTVQQLFDLLRMSSSRDLYTAGRDDDSGFGAFDVSVGLSAKTPLAQGTELDDDVYWLKQNPKRHPRLLGTTRVYSTKSAVEPGKDPQDVYPVYLRRGERLTATASAGSGALLDVGIWSPRTGAFDIGKGTTTYLLSDSQGFTNVPQAAYFARRTGTYYVSVEAPDPPNPADQGGGADTSVEPYTAYTLKLVKNTSRKKNKRPKTKRG